MFKRQLTAAVEAPHWPYEYFKSSLMVQTSTAHASVVAKLLAIECMTWHNNATAITHPLLLHQLLVCCLQRARCQQQHLHLHLLGFVPSSPGEGYPHPPHAV